MATFLTSSGDVADLVGKVGIFLNNIKLLKLKCVSFLCILSYGFFLYIIILQKRWH